MIGHSVFGLFREFLNFFKNFINWELIFMIFFLKFYEFFNFYAFSKRKNCEKIGRMHSRIKKLQKVTSLFLAKNSFRNQECILKSSIFNKRIFIPECKNRSRMHSENFLTNAVLFRNAFRNRIFIPECFPCAPLYNERAHV